jgi:hypothetical protein
MARPRKNITIDFSTLDAAPVGTMHKIAPIAEVVGASGPTVRNRLAEHYGDRITFMRGRKGGFTITGAPQRDTVHTPMGSVDPAVMVG